ncbi:striatin-4 isoform X2 [Hippopotamus amphibius kiboko]|uniref:striatin-4 isoform X2 n=1 Tax=Hippopotamus amphibius kiboko TaxID=575201 RepID=UPI0025929AA6|nr:striatin-4 isoform X2 [Hippopotamus amphibius kiboko]
MMEERAAAAVATAASSCRPLGSSAGPGPTGAAPVSAPAPGPGPAAKGGGGGGSPGPTAGPEPLSLPGILHFIQHEWARFEAEKARWEAERAELQAQVAFLQGERKGQENLKTDLVRRIKMLEYALKQERAKYHKLKFGTDLNQGEKKPELSEQVSNGPVESVTLENSPLVWKEGRQLLRQYLEEVGYTDTILDMRSKRVRSLLGRSLELNGAMEPSEGGPRAMPGPGGLSGGESLLVKQIEEQIKRNAAGKDGKERLGGSVLEQIPFLQNCEDEDSDEDDELDSVQHKKQRVKKALGCTVAAGQELVAAAALAVLGRGMALIVPGGVGHNCAGPLSGPTPALSVWAGCLNLDARSSPGKEEGGAHPIPLLPHGPEAGASQLPPKALVPEMEEEDEEDDSEDAINEFDFLGSGEDGEGSPDPRRCAGEGTHHELESRRVKLQGILADLRDVDGLPPKVPGPPPGTPQPRPHEDVFIMDTIGGGEVSLGDLADLTVTNDNDLSCDLSDSKDAFKKTWNPKFTLRSHYDGIRSLAFHHSQSALLTASEDGTLKLWNLQKAVTAKKNAALDVEPIHAFRAHRGPVLAVAMGSRSEYCYSGGADARIHSWKIPDLNMDPYDGYDPSVLSHVLEGHGDAVWGLAFSPTSQRLASCSADGTVRIWDPSSSPTCLCTFPAASDHGIPTSVAFTSTEPAHIVASFRSGDTILYDLEAGSALLTLDSRGNSGPTQINQVVSHPSQPLSITAHDDRGIRFLDNRTGKSVHSMVAHLDAVTCLAVDPNGVFLISGSHDCSLRLWSLDNKTCVQEITAHRKKHEEAIHAVACHPSKALIASAGADALAKVFV